MKKLLLSITAALIFVSVLSATSITVHAEGFDWNDYFEKARAKREQREKEMTEKWLDDLEKDGNLTQTAIEAASKYGEERIPNHKTPQSSNCVTSAESAGSSYAVPGKGWVYSVDELHVIGLTEGENGYAKPGWYGEID